jgi:hypothetical protein
MSAMTNLLVKDDTVTTRQEFTLQPITDTPAPVWRAAVSGVPLSGQPNLLFDIQKIKTGYKATMKLALPVMESLGTAGTSSGYVAPAKVAYEDAMVVTMYASERSTLQNRADLLAMAVGLLQGASSSSASGTLDQASAGNAFVDSTAPITQAFVQLIKPN